MCGEVIKRTLLPGQLTEQAAKIEPISVDLPAPFSPTMAISPGPRVSKSTDISLGKASLIPRSRIVASRMGGSPSQMAWNNWRLTQEPFPVTVWQRGIRFQGSPCVQVDFQTGGTPLPSLRQTVVNTGNRLRCDGLAPSARHSETEL